jgi:hypothetical protein
VTKRTEKDLAPYWPEYHYPIGRACPECYKPLTSLKRKDGRCFDCLRDKKVLPVNWIRPPKKKSEEEEVEYEYEDA